MLQIYRVRYGYLSSAETSSRISYEVSKTASNTSSKTEAVGLASYTMTNAPACNPCQLIQQQPASANYTAHASYIPRRGRLILLHRRPLAQRTFNDSMLLRQRFQISETDYLIG